LTHLSETSGLPVQRVVGVTRNAGTAPFDAAALRVGAFDDEVISRGLNSRVIEVDNRAYVLRVNEHRPPVQRPLTDVADGIRKQLVQTAATDRARNAAAEAMARVAKGEASTVIASALGLDWKRVPSASRGTPGIDREIIKSAFELPRPTNEERAVTSAELPDGRVAVITVTAVKDGDYGALTETERESIRTQLSRRVGSEEFTALFITSRDAVASICESRAVDRA
jgi:peptidyl-prolyl cis-trans isomerase D